MANPPEYNYPDPKHYAFSTGKLTVEFVMGQWADGKTIGATLAFTAILTDGSTTWAQKEYGDRQIAEFAFRNFGQEEAKAWFTQLWKS